MLLLTFVVKRSPAFAPPEIGRVARTAWRSRHRNIYDHRKSDGTSIALSRSCAPLQWLFQRESVTMKTAPPQTKMEQTSSPRTNQASLRQRKRVSLAADRMRQIMKKRLPPLATGRLRIRGRSRGSRDQVAQGRQRTNARSTRIFRHTTSCAARRTATGTIARPVSWSHS
jgi:hypothetical protein